MVDNDLVYRAMSELSLKEGAAGKMRLVIELSKANK